MIYALLDIAHIRRKRLTCNLPPFAAHNPSSKMMASRGSRRGTIWKLLTRRASCIAILLIHPSPASGFTTTGSWSKEQRSSFHRRSINSDKRASAGGGTHLSAISLLPSLPLIKANDSWGNWAVLSGAATWAQELGKTTTVGRLLGPPVTAMAITFVLASVGVLNPGGSAAAKSLQLLSLQLATPMLLLGADLRDCVNRCGPLLEAFVWAATSTMVACSVGWIVCGGLLTKALGPDGLIVAAALMAKNVGGGINYVAVCRSLSASPEAFAAGLCVDNIFGLIYFPISSALAAGKPDIADKHNPQSSDSSDQSSPQPVSVKQISTALFLASVLTWLGERLGGTAGALPLCTLLTVLVASLSPSRLIVPIQPAAQTLGNCALYLFFATAGAPGLAVAESVKASVLPLSLFLTFLYGMHGLILKTSHSIGRGKGAYAPQRLLVASSAAIGGPTTAAALAQASGWTSLLVPSLLVGNIGYAIATFAGIAYHSIFGGM